MSWTIPGFSWRRDTGEGGEAAGTTPSAVVEFTSSEAERRFCKAVKAVTLATGCDESRAAWMVAAIASYGAQVLADSSHER